MLTLLNNDFMKKIFLFLLTKTFSLWENFDGVTEIL